MSAITFPIIPTIGLPNSNLSSLFSFNLNRPFSTPSTSHSPFSLLRRITSHGLKPFRASINDSLSETTSTITVQNDDALDSTIFVIKARNRIGLLQVITRVFKVLGVLIEKATVEFEGEFFVKKFFVTDSHGKKIEDGENLVRIEKALREAIDGDGGGGRAVAAPSTRGIVVRRAGLGAELGDRRAKVERMFGLMDGFLKNDPISLQKDILDHVEYTVARSRFSFDDFEAYQDDQDEERLYAWN